MLLNLRTLDYSQEFFIIEDARCGGTVHNSSYVRGVCIGTPIDSFSAIKYHVFDKKALSMEELSDTLKNNFEGSERIRQLLLNSTPKYGNDGDYTDALMKELFEANYN